MKIKKTGGRPGLFLSLLFSCPPVWGGSGQGKKILSLLRFLLSRLSQAGVGLYSVRNANQKRTKCKFEHRKFYRPYPCLRRDDKTCLRRDDKTCLRRDDKKEKNSVILWLDHRIQVYVRNANQKLNIVKVRMP